MTSKYFLPEAQFSLWVTWTLEQESIQIVFVKREITSLQTTNQNSLIAQPREIVLITN